MQPDKVVLRHIRLRLRTPFVSALGVEHEREIVIVEVHADGCVGFGEVPVLARPVYNEETVVTAWHVLNDFFVPAAFAAPLSAPQDVPRRLAGFKGHAFAKAGLEAAVWDVWARRRGVSLQQLLAEAAAPLQQSSHVHVAQDGARPQVARRVPSGVVVGMAADGRYDEGTLLRRVETFLEQRYRRIKIKIEPGKDEKPLAAIRRAFPHIDLAVDANGTYLPSDAETLRRLDRFQLSYIEQPLAPPDMLEHAQLQKNVETAVGLDESIGSARQVRQALQLGSCRVVNIKASRVGGLTEAVAVHDVCYKAGVGVLCGGLLESGIGRAHNVALASLPGFTLAGDLSASARYWERDIVTPPFELDKEGFVTVPSGPGIGVDVDRKFLNRVTVASQEHTLR